MAPRAAARLESLGFEKVYEYKAGKLDWLAAGLPTEGENSDCPRAGDVSRKDVIVSHPNDRLGDVAERARKAGWEVVFVVDAEHVVLGMLRSNELAMGPNLLVEQAMRPGPSTFRPYVSSKEMAIYMIDHELENALITTSDGKLVGLLFKSEAIRVAGSNTSCARKMITR
jgi:Mg/Co/Ni transporter MgtE